MEFTNETRKKLVSDCKAAWKKRLLLIFGKTKELAEAMESFGEYRADFSFISRTLEQYDKAGNLPLSVFFKKEYKGLAEAFAGKEQAEDYWHIVDKLVQFPYSTGLYRRTVRSDSYRPFIEHALRLMYDYRTLGFYGGNLADYLANRLPEPLLDLKKSQIHLRFSYLDDIIAARIDAGDQVITGLIREMITADNNTAVLSTPVIRGIIKSSDAGLHRLLADFLVAARLQEGIRQAVCENADCGTLEGFLTIFDTICEHDLIRFAAVKRAVATWTGIGGYEDIDRITAKVVSDIRPAVDDIGRAYEFVESNDSIHILVGLWAIGLRNVRDAVALMEQWLDKGTKNQLLTMCYYNNQLDFGDFSGRIAREMVRRHSGSGELEYVAACLPSYLGNADRLVFEALNRQGGNRNKKKEYKPISVRRLFGDEAEAREHFGYMRDMYERIPKKRLEWSPCIFPWYGVYISKTALLRRMSCVAYMLEDEELKLYVAEHLDGIDGSENYAARGNYVELLLHDPRTDAQTACLISFVADKETSARNAAYEIARELPLTPKQYRRLEEFLKYKNSDIRQNTLRLLGRQEGEALVSCVERLLASDKESVREGGLSLVLAQKKKEQEGGQPAVSARKEQEGGRAASIRKEQESGMSGSAVLTVSSNADEESESVMERLLAAVRDLSAPTDKEKVLTEEILGNSSSDAVLNAEGYGLYRPDAPLHMEVPACDKQWLESYFSVSVREIGDTIEKLRTLLTENQELEYQSITGEKRLLGSGIVQQVFPFKNPPYADRYPFKELWIKFYEQEIRNPDRLNLLLLAVQQGRGDCPEGIRKWEKKLLGSIADYSKSYRSFRHERSYSDDVHTVLTILQSIYGNGSLRRAGLEIGRYLLSEVPKEELWHTVSHPASYYRGAYEEPVSLAKDALLAPLLNAAMTWSSPEEFRESFSCFYEIDERFRFNEVAGRTETPYYYSSTGSNQNKLGILEYVKACELGIIPEEAVYKSMFDTLGLEFCLRELGMLYQEKLYPYQRNRLNRFLSAKEREAEKIDTESFFYQTGNRIYQKAVDRILDVELGRGELATVFSKNVLKIERFFGMNRLVQILVALGKEKLDRRGYYGYWGRGDVSRQVSFSHLLQVCWPLPGDDAKGLGRLLSGVKLSEQRLIETAMYAPQWMDIIEAYLGYPGFKLGCYYFMAHMNERFDDRKKAVIAKYTPLSTEELNRGAFDVNWFEEAYEKLGEENFDKLYDAAKYISDGSKHARARKYADAALGRVTVSELEAAVCDKRNKDLLMSYALVPFKEKGELVRRYEFIRKFQKESRQFGARRRASEGVAADMALRNLATKAGYEDTARLTLAMETELVKTYAQYLEWQEVGAVRIRIEIDDLGRAEILCEKNGKPMKSIPSALKKDDYVIRIREVQKKLKEQYTRTVAMFEQAMESSEQFTFGELKNLCENPVTAAVVKALVFVKEDGTCGFLDEKGLADADGTVYPLDFEGRLLVAHPWNLYRAGVWSRYQEYFYRGAAQGIVKKQPFKQVFRELYVKLPEEQKMCHSLMFAGNQIQPSRTVACLKGRRWVADYEEGLQKIYYKENIIARIYALADWFSPSDIEAPTLEWVEFSDRKTFESIAIEDVPDIIYSEVMRDVDLAVSVAHAGGVDPETSHSTIEMRRVILSFNLPLFKIKNVKLEGSHAIVEGKLGKYSIHLGSGVIHQMGGHQINVLPVHSQSRGKLFVPFVDEDPKTAEIMSKILLFARDEKIKDPYILDQIM